MGNSSTSYLSALPFSPQSLLERDSTVHHVSSATTKYHLSVCAGCLKSLSPHRQSEAIYLFSKTRGDSLWHWEQYRKNRRLASLSACMRGSWADDAWTSIDMLCFQLSLWSGPRSGWIGGLIGCCRADSHHSPSLYITWFGLGSDQGFPLLLF